MCQMGVSSESIKLSSIGITRQLDSDLAFKFSRSTINLRNQHHHTGVVDKKLKKNMYKNAISLLQCEIIVKTKDIKTC